MKADRIKRFLGGLVVWLLFAGWMYACVTGESGPSAPEPGVQYDGGAP